MSYIINMNGHNFPPKDAELDAKLNLTDRRYRTRNIECIGMEIPKYVPYTDYYNYIWKFSPRKPYYERNDIDDKIYDSWHHRLMVASNIRKFKEPLTDKQKRIIERVRNGTDFAVWSTSEFLKLLE